MKLKPLLSHRTLLLSSSFSSASSSCSSSPYTTILFSHFSTSQNYPSNSHSTRRGSDDESKNVRVFVWWDFENCNLPAGVNVFKVSRMITAAIRANGIKGPIQITAFGDIIQLSRANQEALSSTGINLAHVPNGGKNSADRSLLVDLMYWVSQNPPPAHLFLISGDRDFASILHRLRMNNYNILLASTDHAPSVLCSAASIMWQWNALIKGENLTGRHFNQPPDGPYGSWYGHYKGPLEDPFSVVEQSSSQNEELSESEPKIHPVPKVVIKQIQNILNSYPKGVSFKELSSELSKTNVGLDKDLYGYKKFSRFLLSMPHILKLRPGSDGKFLVHGISPKPPEPFEDSSGISTGSLNKDQDQDFMVCSKSKSNDQEVSVTAVVDGITKLPPQLEVNVEQPSRKIQQLSPAHEKVVKLDMGESPDELKQPPPVGEKVVKVAGAQATEGHLPPVMKQDTVSEVGFFRKIWKRWFGGDDSGCQVRSHDIPEKCHNFEKSSEKKSGNGSEKPCTSGGNSETTKVQEKQMNTGPVHPVSFSSPSDYLGLNQNTDTCSEAYSDKSSSPGLFNRIVSWCKFWGSSPKPDTLGDQSSGRPIQMNSYSGISEVFAEHSFWTQMEAFMDTPRASALVSESRTREQMAENLQKEGPLMLKSRSNNELLHMVDLLITEKKWVEECPSLLSPFTLTQPISKNSSSSPSHTPNGLSSIFLGTSPPSKLPKSSEYDETKFQNTSHKGVSVPVTNKKPSDRLRSELLMDCQKLVNEVLKKHPEGYNMGTFKKLFHERYGYPLDYQKLGYKKLASLFQIMPGVKIESSYIIPRGMAPKMSGLETAIPSSQGNDATVTLDSSNSELSDSSKKDDDSDSSWEELGPISNTASDTDIKELQSGLRIGSISETQTQSYADYEPSVSDDEFTDSEGETATPNEPEGRWKEGVNDQDSSLLQILDSWYSSKEGDNTKDKLGNIDGMVDCSSKSSKASDFLGAGSKDETFLGKPRLKQRPHKVYKFVSDQVGDDKEKLIDGILVSLKKTGESRMQS